MIGDCITNDQGPGKSMTNLVTYDADDRLINIRFKGRIDKALIRQLAVNEILELTKKQSKEMTSLLALVSLRARWDIFTILRDAARTPSASDRSSSKQWLGY